MPTEVQIKLTNYTTDFYTVGGSQYVDSNCNTITFINYGTSIVKVEAVTLQPNQSLELGGNAGEFTTQRFYINFGTSVAGNNLVIVRKIYLL